MPCIPIHDLDDPRLEPYRHLKRTNLTRWSNQFIAEGLPVVERLLASSFEVVSVLASERRRDQIAPSVPSEIPLYVLPQALAEEFVGYSFHTGVLACGLRGAAPSLEEIIERAGAGLTLAVCPDVNDPENLGAIIRSCDALGVDALLLGRGSAFPFSRRVSRVSMGSAYRLPIIDTERLRDDVVRLRDEFAVELVATVLDESAEPLLTAPRPERLAILFGNERHGLSADWLELCRRRVTIPMQAGVDSLNVSVAAGIVLHHFTHRAAAE